MREQEHADLRDAIAVLTADQQATMWEMRSAWMGHGRRGPGGLHGGRRGQRPGGPMGFNRDGHRPQQGPPANLRQPQG
jgi:hypothetical protein